MSHSETAFNCLLPDQCRLESVYMRKYIELNEKGTVKNLAILCDIKTDEYEFKYSNRSIRIDGERCSLFEDRDHVKYQETIFRWTSDSRSRILDKRLNLTNAMRYFSNFKSTVNVNFWNLNGFDVNLYKVQLKNTFIKSIELSNSRLEFYLNKSRIQSCQDIRNHEIHSIFQIKLDPRSGIQGEKLTLRNCEFPKSGLLCPLVFTKAQIYQLIVVNMANSFYKTNVLRFSNKTYKNLNSKITYLQFNDVVNVDFDLNLLHPSVFNDTNKIVVYSGSLNSISGSIFTSLKHLNSIQLNPVILRKICHMQGIDWIRKMNAEVNVNVSDLNCATNVKSHFKQVAIIGSVKQRKRISKLFPESDFCLYVDFPFSQLVIFFDRMNLEEIDLFEMYMENEYSCTYLWLLQYYEFYYRHFLNIYGQTGIFTNYTLIVLNSTAFKSISKCDFEQKISFCNKTNYKIKDIWDENDFFNLNKKLEIAIKISLYPISLLCLITNLIVVIVIVKKDNSDLFKDIKQYSYLYINSIFCILISLIEILSWMTECFYPFQVFCPEIRKLVAIQFFRIIFKECLVTVFRFMCNFTYIAFALNRIGLIGKDHGKIVTFICEIGIKKYIFISLLISVLFSWIKYFKYEVNYFYPDMNYPISNELDIILSESTRFNDFYFTFNSISDLINYFVFLLICLIIDICMVVQLRRILDEKAMKIESMKITIIALNPSKPSEFEEAVNKAIKMVIVNSSIGFVFKLPVSLIPVVNLYAEFYYKSDFNVYLNPGFREFYSMLFDTGFYGLIQDVTSLLFTFSLSVQLFIYNYFDKKFRIGYDRVLGRAFKKSIDEFEQKN